MASNLQRNSFDNTSQNAAAQGSGVNARPVESADQDNYRGSIDISDGYEKLGKAQTVQSTFRDDERRIDDDLAMLQAERVASQSQRAAERTEGGRSVSLNRTRTRHTDPVDDFDIATNPVYENNPVYRPPEDPSTKLARFVKRVHESSFLIRYFTYIAPLAVLLLIPLLFGALLFKKASVGGVQLKWFSVWLEIFWLGLWAGRIAAKMIPWPLGILTSLFTNNSKKWRDMAKQLELPMTLFFWWLGVEVSFLPIMRNYTVPGFTGSLAWTKTVNKIIISVFVGVILNLAEKIIIQLIAISFHLRTYEDRIEMNKFQIGSLTKLYKYSKEKIDMLDSDFEDQKESAPASGSRTPMQYVEKAQKNFTEAFRHAGDIAGKVAGDFTGKQVKKSTHPSQVILLLLNSTSGSQVLARRLYRTFVREGCDTVSKDELRPAFDNDDECNAAFAMFDKDLNNDISMEELEAVCVEIGRERKSITASLKDLDSVVSKLDAILVFIVVCVTILVFITLISTSAAGVLTSAGSSVLALSWLFSATAQEFLQSIVFVFVKHPFDVGDRVTIYGNTGTSLTGDDYFVKEISLLYTEFKKMEGHVVQAPNSYLNGLFILNMRRSGGLAEAIHLTVKFGTTLEQIEELRNQLLEFVRSEKREYQDSILTEIRDVVEAYSVNLNVVFFYKSNWQNELLRLQRRNKFICALMISMQEIGIQGPRYNIPGQLEETPFYVKYPQHTPVAEHAPPPDRSPNIPAVTTDDKMSQMSGDNQATRQQSILRSPSSAFRSRGESISSMAKRVDFSLGMKGLSSSDVLGDVYDDNPQVRIPDRFREGRNRSGSHSKIDEEPEESAAAYSSATRQGSIRQRFGVPRSPVDQSRGVHRNRFFSRASPSMEPRTGDDALMEQGMAGVQRMNLSVERIEETTEPPIRKAGSEQSREGAREKF